MHSVFVIHCTSPLILPMNTLIHYSIRYGSFFIGLPHHLTFWSCPQLTFGVLFHMNIRFIQIQLHKIWYNLVCTKPPLNKKIHARWANLACFAKSFYCQVWCLDWKTWLWLLIHFAANLLKLPTESTLEVDSSTSKVLI